MLHPVIDIQASLLNYFHSATCFQVENAFLHANLMWKYKPSEIAIAAILRIVYKVEEDKCDRLLEKLSPVIGSDEREVHMAMCEFHNAVPNFSRSEEFEAVMTASIAAVDMPRLSALSMPSIIGQSRLVALMESKKLSKGSMLHFP